MLGQFKRGKSSLLNALLRSAGAAHRRVAGDRAAHFPVACRVAALCAWSSCDGTSEDRALTDVGELQRQLARW